MLIDCETGGEVLFAEDEAAEVVTTARGKFSLKRGREMTLVVIRVVYAENIPVSVTAPMSFEGETAKVQAAAYVKELLTSDDFRRTGEARSEYHVLPIGDMSNTACFRSAPAISFHKRVTMPQMNVKVEKFNG